MPGNLIPEEFTEEHLAEVQDFDCGGEAWEVEVSDWIKRPPGQGGVPGALDEKYDPDRPSRVWLYRTVDGTLIGFGSLGYSRWSFPKKKDSKLPLTVIPWCAIQRKFWGLPEGPKEARYSHDVMDHLITEAIKDAETHPLLGLMVHPENTRAIAFYKAYEFRDDLDPYKDKYSGITYNKMALVLDGEIVARMVQEGKTKR